MPLIFPSCTEAVCAPHQLLDVPIAVQHVTQWSMVSIPYRFSVAFRSSSLVKMCCRCSPPLSDLGNPWDSARYSTGVVQVFVPKKSYQHLLFVRYSSSKKAPRDERISKEAENVSKQDLGRHTPQKPSNIARMAAKAVHLARAATLAAFKNTHTKALRGIELSQLQR